MERNKITKIITLLIAILLAIFIYPTESQASQSGLVIDEFKISGATTTDEYFVLANYGSSEINLKDFSVIKKTTSGRSYTIIPKMAEYFLPPATRIFFGHTNYLGDKDYTYSTNTLAADNCFMILDPNGEIVDLVGYGDAYIFEGSPLLNPKTSEIYQRLNGSDADNNLLDFVKVIISEPLDPNIYRIVISELLPDPAEGSEWFEIYNPTNAVINLYGLKACDQLGSTKCYRFPKDKTIAPFSYLVFEQPITKLTFNNDGDGLELLDLEDNPIFATGSGYIDAIDGASFALFGSTWRWTSTVTKGGQNIFTDIIEVEKIKKKKTTKKSSKKTTPTADYGYSDDSTSFDLGSDTIKGAEAVRQEEGVSEKTIGWLLIIASVFLTLGYSIFTERKKFDGIFQRIIKRND